MADVKKTYDEFAKELKGKSTNIAKAQELLSTLKLAIMDFAHESGKDPVMAEVVLARDVLEGAVVLAVRAKDLSEFERAIAQLLPYYKDYAALLKPSASQFKSLGLNLMRLLAANRIADFHIALELIPASEHSNPFIQFPLLLEQYLMEGAYVKVFKAKADAPAEEYLFFMETLFTTVLEKIADVVEAAYTDIPTAYLMNQLQMKDSKAFAAFASKRGWTISGSSVKFNRSGDASQQVPAVKLIKHTIGYARELERII